MQQQSRACTNRVFVPQTCLIMDMRIGGEQSEVHPFSHDKKEQPKHLFLRQGAEWLESDTLPEKSWKTGELSNRWWKCMYYKISFHEEKHLTAPKKYIQSVGGQMTTSTEVSVRTQRMGPWNRTERDGRCRRPNTGDAISHTLTQNKSSR